MSRGIRKSQGITAFPFEHIYHGIVCIVATVLLVDNNNTNNNKKHFIILESCLKLSPTVDVFQSEKSHKEAAVK